MAIYHFSAQVISRSKGQSSVASASYRSGDRLTDERTGETKYYAREAKPDTMILAPSNAPSWVQDRNRLWNEVEKKETRKNSQVAREINIALPRELSNDQQKELITNFTKQQFVDKGMVADVAIHRDDKENPHAHIMLTTREISEEGFTTKNRDWNDKALLTQWREQWADHANKSLEREGIQERITHESHEKRGLELLPSVHLGHVAHSMEKKGIESDRGNINRDRQEFNRIVVDLQKYREEKERLQEKEQARLKQESFKKDPMQSVINDFFNKINEPKTSTVHEKPIDKTPIPINQEVRNQLDELMNRSKQADIKEPVQAKPVQEEITQEKKPADFLTFAERKAIKEAVPIVNGFVTREKIADRKVQIDQWEQKISKAESYNEWKAQAFEKARGHFNRQHNLEQQIDQNKKQIENISWANPFKLKENRLTKERCEKGIERLEKDHELHEGKLNYFREKLNFTDKNDFMKKDKIFEEQRQKQASTHFKQKQEIKEQRDILSNADKALKQGEIRKIASDYPELKTAGEHLTYENAMKIKELNDKAGKVVPLHEIKATIQERTNRIKEHTTRIQVHDRAVQQTKIAENYFEKLHEIEQKIEKTESNPFLKGKLMFSKEAKEQHTQDIQKRDEYKSALEKMGYSNKDQLDQTKKLLDDKSENEQPQIKDELEANKTGQYQGGHNASMGLLEAVMQGVQQAQDQEVREHKKRQKQRSKGEKQRDMGIER